MATKDHFGWHRMSWACVVFLGGSLTLGAIACNPSSLIDVQTPGSVVDPSAISTPAAAKQFYNSAIATFYQGYAGGGDVTQNLVAGTGMFTDELELAITFNDVSLDTRTGQLAKPYGPIYQLINQSRAGLQEAREALRLYAPGTEAMRSQLQALEANTVLWLAENWCSGVPLSVVHLIGSPEPTGPLSTTELLQRAVAMFDSSIALNADSMRFVNLAKVGKARALLGLGEFDSAAAVVHDVPTDFVYYARYGIVVNAIGFTYYASGRPQVWARDREGGNGLVWSVDPRAAITLVGGNLPAPAKYSVTPGISGTPDFATAVVTPKADAPVRVADGLEARLIEAEAAMRHGDATWLTTLNTLRHDCIGTAMCAPVPGLTAGNLPDTLTDPGIDSARVDLLFRERAMWLYLTGHRQGDLRRLVRQYGRDRENVWPSGVYFNPGSSIWYNIPSSANGTPYGTDVVFTTEEVSQSGGNETTYNPLYHGCLNLDP